MTLTATIAIDLKNVDVVKQALAAAGDLVSEIAKLQTFAPGQVDPIVMPRSALAPVFELSDALAGVLLGEPIEAPALPVHAEERQTGRYQVLVPDPEKPDTERIALETDDRQQAIATAQQRFGRIWDGQDAVDVDVPPTI